MTETEAKLRTTCPCGAVHEAPTIVSVIYHQTVQFFLQAHRSCLDQYWAQARETENSELGKRP